MVARSPHHCSSPNPSSNNEVLYPVGDCVAMKGGTYGSIFWQLLQKRALMDHGYAWCQIEDLLLLLNDMPDFPVAKDIVAGKLRQNAGDFLSELINHNLIEIDEDANVRIHASHHRAPYTFLI